MTCISGPPCRPGNRAALIFLPSSGSLPTTMPPRGPRSVLCVVVVHDMRVRQRAGKDAGGDQPGEMRHIDHEIRADLIGDAADPGESR